MAEQALDLIGRSVLVKAQEVFEELRGMEIPERIATLNALRLALHELSPFSAEPVDCVLWVKAEELQANDYNPNTVASPEMKLLQHSIVEDGYTQPIVAWVDQEHYEVIDGFHRNRVGRESAEVRKRIHGYLPVTVINAARQDRNDRIASTIRHNRARGKHQVSAMSEIVVELKKRNWSDERIGKELGMEPDEVLRLSQISGLAEMFSNRAFSESWDHVKDGAESEVEPTDESGKPIDLDWMKPRSAAVEGWDDRTDTTSILAEGGVYRGMIQKSRFNPEWFWYAYTQPPMSGRGATKREAVERVELVTKYGAHEKDLASF